MISTTYLYGPQTSGKTTRLLNLIQKDRGADLAFSGENRFVIDNGHRMVDVTAGIPKVWTQETTKHFVKRIQSAALRIPRIRHVIIDGEQFLSITNLKKLYRIVRKQCPRSPVVFSGCLYYLGKKPRMILTSRFLLHHCDRIAHVQRRCEFCSHLADFLWSRQIRSRGSHTVAVVDPHLVCRQHYQQLNQQIRSKKSLL